MGDPVTADADISPGFFFPRSLPATMGWTTLLAIGLFAFACLTAIYQSQKDDWDTNRTVGMFVFLAGATCGVFLDDFLSTESSLLPWIEPIAAVIMLIGLFIAWVWKPERDNP